jgi:hypothetical protein
MGKQKR